MNPIEAHVTILAKSIAASSFSNCIAMHRSTVSLDPTRVVSFSSGRPAFSGFGLSP
jgi:hypothetical protein